MVAVSQDLDFVHTGPDTLAGRYLRMFWQPVCRAQDLQLGRAVPIQIMNETFTLYRGEGGTAHAVAFRCAHRGTQLSTGWVEGDCIRCRYHGWKYDETGQCVEQPGEDESFAVKVRIRSYPVREYLGLVFAYLGEGEPPPFRRFPDFERPDVLVVNEVSEYYPCNFFNRLDNAPDMGHVAFAHAESTRRTNRVLNRPDRRIILSLSFEETEYGLRTTAVAGASGAPRHLHFHMPNINQVGGVSTGGGSIEGTAQDSVALRSERLFWRVPIDDEHCISYIAGIIYISGAQAEEYLQRRDEALKRAAEADSIEEIGDAILAGKMTIEDMDTRLTSRRTFSLEDYVTQVGQGAIIDRSQEHLGRMDGGTILLRRLWQRELRALAEGRPLTQWRTPAGLSDMNIV
jgi:5,5'-dehydrodivanillate O-demethylase oxygenase subunit